MALPTETVYGIAVRADRSAVLAALAELKRRPVEQPWTWHVGSSAALERFRRVSPVARRLVERYWPGPLTLVLPGVPTGLEGTTRDGWTGVRSVAHPLTAALLAGFEFPIVMTSTNLHGEPPALDANAIEAGALASGIDLVVDSGPCTLSVASSVLKVGPGKFELLREGLYDLRQLRAAAGLRIGFACTGNTCRSPMAEGLARAMLAKRLEVPAQELDTFGFELESFGVFASAGTPAAEHAVDVLRQRGIAIDEHRSRPARSERVMELDRVYCMTRAHLDALELLLPPGKARHLEMLDPEGLDVPDPIGGTVAEYRRCAETLAELLERRLDEWA